MTETLIDRAADAICGQAGAYIADPERPDEPATFVPGFCEPTGEEQRAVAVGIVRAVLMAIRQPTIEIVQAGFEAEATADPDKTRPHHVVPAVWSAMIDAALADPSNQP